MSTPRPTTQSGPRRSWVVLSLIVVLAVVLVAIAVTSDDGGPSAQQPTEPAPEAPAVEPDDGPVADTVDPEQAEIPDMARRDADDPLAQGPVDAPVVMVVYSDYQCPYCAVWNERTMPDLEPYVEAGDLRIEWRDINVFGEDSARGSRAAYAAGLQGRFWDYHAELFAGGETPTPSRLTQTGLVELAEQIGLDVEQFTADLNSEEVATAVQANADEGASIGAFSTPSFVINATPVVGAQPTEAFVAVIEEALAQAAG